MAERSIVVRLKAEVGDLKRGFAQASQAGQDFGKRVDDAVAKNGQNINTLATSAGALGLAMAAGAGLAVKRFADFDQAMSAVQAATLESADNMALLRDAAVEAGAETAFSASEAAGAIEALAKAGVSTTDILGGGLKGALNLAAAGQMDVAQAAEIAATTMTQFGKSGEDVGHIADLLAAGAGNAQGEVTDMAQALKFAGVPLAQLGVSMEETAGTIALFAKNGIVGEQAGTSLRSMIASLTSPSALARTKLDELGISVFDATGEFVGLDGVAGQLRERMLRLTDAERAEALGRIFGNESLQAANVLYAEGAEGVQEWTRAVDDQGFAADQARIKTDNLRGDLERLSGSLDSVFIQSGSGANDTLREMAQGAEALVDKIGELPGPVLNVTTLLTGAGGLGLAGVAGIGKLITSVQDAKSAFAGLTGSAKGASVAVGAIGGALAVLTVGLGMWASEEAEANAQAEALKDTLDELTGATTASTEAWIADELVKSGAARAYRILGGDVSDLVAAAMGAEEALGRVNSILDAREEETAWKTIVGDIKGLDDTVNTVRGGLGDMSSALEAGTTDWQLMQDAANGSTAAQEDAATAFAETSLAIDEQVDALGTLLEAQREQMGIVLSQREAQREFQAALDAATAALEENGATLDITTEAGRANQSALDDIAESGRAVVDSMRENGASQAELQAAMQVTRDQVIAFGQAMGLTEADAVALADQMKLIPGEVPIDVVTNTAAATEQIEAFRLRYAGKSIGQISMDIKLNYPNLNRAQVAAATRLTAQAAAYQAGKGYATGGPIIGPGTGTSDSVPILASNGEYVIKASTVGKMPRSYWDNLNAGRFAQGGLVGAAGAAAAAVFPDTVRLAPESVDAVAAAIVAGAHTVSSSVVAGAQTSRRQALVQGRRA